MTTESTQLAIEDYDAIEEAVMETARGRWFLAEYARRHRQADTLTIVGTLERIERTMNRQRKVPDIDRIKLDLADMAEAITRTKQEIFQMKVEAEEGGRFAEASNELDAIVSQTETATEIILLNAEKAQELAWTLRESGADGDVCDNLENAITEIYTGCSFQDLTGQRTRKVVTVLRYLESRINSMTGIWGLDESEEKDIEINVKSADETVADGLEALSRAAELRPDVTLKDMQFDPFDTRPDAHLLNGPQLEGRGVDQSEIDDLMNFNSADDFVAVPAEQMGQSSQAAIDEVEFDSIELESDTNVFLSVDAEAEADVFAPAPAADGPVVSSRSVRAPTSGNTALAIDVEEEIAPATGAALKVVKSQDPIAGLSTEEKMIVFG